MKKLLAALLAAIMVLGLAACGPTQTGIDTENLEIHEEVTGKVVIYTSMYQDIIEALQVTLDKVFPNCDIEFFQSGTGTIQSKVTAEIESGKLGCDILMVAEPSYALELKEMGILHAYKSPEAANLAFDYDPDGYWYPVRISNMVLAYNPDKFSKDEVAQSLKDFAYDESLKGMISMSNPLTSGTALASAVALSSNYGYEYFDALAKQEVMIESGSVALTKLETGECKEVMILEESVLKKREEEQSKIECIYPTDGTIVCPSPIMTIKDDMSANANSAACEVITDWFLSQVGQSAIVKGWMHSVRSDYPEPPYDAISTKEITANEMPIDWEFCYKNRSEVRTAFEERVKMPEG